MASLGVFSGGALAARRQSVLGQNTMAFSDTCEQGVWGAPGCSGALPVQRTGDWDGRDGQEQAVVYRGCIYIQRKK